MGVIGVSPGLRSLSNLHCRAIPGGTPAISAAQPRHREEVRRGCARIIRKFVAFCCILLHFSRYREVGWVSWVIGCNADGEGRAPVCRDFFYYFCSILFHFPVLRGFGGGRPPIHSLVHAFLFVKSRKARGRVDCRFQSGVSPACGSVRGQRRIQKACVRNGVRVVTAYT